MKRLVCAGVVAAAFGAALVPLTAAETAKFKFVAAVYFDVKGGGLSQPEGVACDRNGNVVVGDTGNNRLLRFTYREQAIAGGTEVKIPELSSPTRVVLNSKGEIYALDSMQRRVAHLGAGGEFKEALSYGDAPAAGSVVPKDIAIDGADNLYVLDVFGARVLVLKAEGKFEKAIAVPADAGFASELAVDSSGTVFLLDSIKRRLYSAAKDAPALAPLGGELGQYIATLPTAMTTGRGGLFVVQGTGSIVTLGRDGAFLSRQLTGGWNEGSLNRPGQLCINDKDEAFIADRDNSRVQVFQLVR